MLQEMAPWGYVRDVATERWAKNGGCVAKNGGENEGGTNERARERKCVKQSELAAGDSLGQRGDTLGGL